MPKRPVGKIELLEELYLQLAMEITQTEIVESITPDQVTTISSEEFIFEVKFRKKKNGTLKLINNDDELIGFLFILWGVEHLINGALEQSLLSLV